MTPKVTAVAKPAGVTPSGFAWHVEVFQDGKAHIDEIGVVSAFDLEAYLNVDTFDSFLLARGYWPSGSWKSEDDGSAASAVHRIPDSNCPDWCESEHLGVDALSEEPGSWLVVHSKHLGHVRYQKSFVTADVVQEVVLSDGTCRKTAPAILLSAEDSMLDAAALKHVADLARAAAKLLDSISDPVRTTRQASPAHGRKAS